MAASPNKKHRASVIPDLDTPVKETAPAKEAVQPEQKPQTESNVVTETSTQTTPVTAQPEVQVESLDAASKKTEEETVATQAPPKEQSSTTATPTSTPAPTPKASTPTLQSYGDIPLEKKNSQLYKIGIALLILILSLTGVVLYLRGTVSTQETETAEDQVVAPTPATTATATPEATPEIVQLEREEITLEILNGTGIAGLAGDTSDIFEELGYTVESVGNADDSSENILLVSEEDRERIKVLLKDASDELDISEATISEEELDVTARIILGAVE